MSVFRVAPFGPTSWTPGLDGLQGQFVDEGGSSALSLAMSVQKRRACLPYRCPERDMKMMGFSRFQCVFMGFQWV